MLPANASINAHAPMARAIGGVPWRLREGCSIVFWCDERSAAQVRKKLPDRTPAEAPRQRSPARLA